MEIIPWAPVALAAMLHTGFIVFLRGARKQDVSWGNIALWAGSTSWFMYCMGLLG